MSGSQQLKKKARLHRLKQRIERMNGNQAGMGQVPLIGHGPTKEQLQHAALGQLIMGMYVPLVPQLAIFRLARGYEVDGALTEPATPERIADEAASIVAAAVGRFTQGIQIKVG